MNLFTGESADAFFGGEVPPAVRELLHRAAETGAQQRTPLLWTAQALAPTCLAVYYTLYKHHAGRREFEQAEEAARRGLKQAAAQAGLDEDWSAVQPDPRRDFLHDGPARFWLFTLKALAFIHLRSSRPDEARALLLQIDRLAPQARLGTDVTASLLAGGSPGTDRS
ncbi:hypothetical protein C7444_11412 [Sphaerotilus hippei]|uniref:Tetratricopeptide repeat protein n=1 Tax=Sphaerotilus hippei TaxID=744406 RepID=A0A318GX59_9BURK|nr:hypothetical protein [Sphaerotilus hippei]PXW94313.1 hypothetical protein C7444_11412 [Sphaerotilus hippei]